MSTTVAQLNDTNYLQIIFQNLRFDFFFYFLFYSIWNLNLRNKLRSIMVKQLLISNSILFLDFYFK